MASVSTQALFRENVHLSIDASVTALS